MLRLQTRWSFTRVKFMKLRIEDKLTQVLFTSPFARISHPKELRHVPTNHFRLNTQNRSTSSHYPTPSDDRDGLRKTSVTERRWDHRRIYVRVLVPFNAQSLKARRISAIVAEPFLCRCEATFILQM